jgi:hypothetical protein
MTLLGGQSETARMLLDTKLPSVYIRYERQGKRTPVHSGESQEGVWLRLRNNTSGAISLCTESAYIGPNTVPLKLASGKGILGLSMANSNLTRLPVFGTTLDNAAAMYNG